MVDRGGRGEEDKSKIDYKFQLKRLDGPGNRLVIDAYIKKYETKKKEKEESKQGGEGSYLFFLSTRVNLFIQPCKPPHSSFHLEKDAFTLNPITKANSTCD